MTGQGWFKRIFSFQGSANRLALTFALGICLGVIPGTGAMVAAALATALRLNLPVMVAGALLTNPLTTPFIYAGSFLLGQWMLGDLLPEGKVSRVVLGTVAGNLLLAIAMAMAGYAVMWLLIVIVRRRTHVVGH